jgi:predicted transcriptional regulator
MLLQLLLILYCGAIYWSREWYRYTGVLCFDKAGRYTYDEPADDLGRTIADARRDCETDKERQKLDNMLEDHKKSLYPKCKNGLKKLGSTL